MNDILPPTNLWALFLLFIGRRKRFKVIGQSMLPLLEQGEEILIDPHAYKKSPPQINDVVITNHPHDARLTIVKRVTKMALDGSCFLTGDNPAASTDSRHWGSIARENIIGKATNRFT